MYLIYNIIYYNINIVINLTQFYTTRLNRGGDAQRKQKKLPLISKNWYMVEKVKRCLINKT